MFELHCKNCTIISGFHTNNFGQCMPESVFVIVFSNDFDMENDDDFLRRWFHFSETNFSNSFLYQTKTFSIACLNNEECVL